MFDLEYVCVSNLDVEGPLVSGGCGYGLIL